MKHPLSTPATPPVSIIDADVVVEDDRWGSEADQQTVIATALAALAQHNPQGLNGPSAATILLSSDAHVARLNEQFRSQAKPTNVLSFPASPDASGPDEPAYLGDIILAFETVAREADAAGITLHHHLQHLAVHGMLHLLGYDHIIETDAIEMEALETRILTSIGIADPYAI